MLVILSFIENHEELDHGTDASFHIHTVNTIEEAAKYITNGLISARKAPALHYILSGWNQLAALGRGFSDIAMPGADSIKSVYYDVNDKALEESDETLIMTTSIKKLVKFKLGKYEKDKVEAEAAVRDSINKKSQERLDEADRRQYEFLKAKFEGMKS